MNYTKIHDVIIARARNRQYNSQVHHKHHIIPLHEDKNSKETVVLTFKEHRLIHFLRYKMNGSLGNLYAYYILKGSQNTLILSKLGGQLGGASTKKYKKGIFADTWDRSAETKRRWEEGIISRDKMSNLMKSGLAKRLGEDMVKSKKGIFSDTWDSSKNSKEIWNNLSVEEKDRRSVLNKKHAALGGLITKENKLGFFSLSDYEKTKNCSKGGKAHKGKIWITNGIKNTRILDEELNHYITLGWCKGRKNFNKKDLK
jgi:hypothetical protein